MKFLNIFKKKQEQPQNETPVVASITYSIDNTGEMFVDVNMEDFNDQSINGLSTIISMISTVKCTLITLEMIKNAFAEEGKFEEYLDLITQVTLKNEVAAVSDKNNESNKEEPYIKPSDML
jgi:hypothetical protein